MLGLHLAEDGIHLLPSLRRKVETSGTLQWRKTIGMVPQCSAWERFFLRLRKDAEGVPQPAMAALNDANTDRSANDLPHL